MKKLIFLLLCCTLGMLAFGQDFEAIAEFKFDGKESYQPEEPRVLECANYLFSHPVSKDRAYRKVANRHILLWMEGTPEYTFSIEEQAMELIDGNASLLSLYFAGLTKVALEHEGEALSYEEMHDATANLLADYCADSNNGVKPSKVLKKILKKRKG